MPKENAATTVRGIQDAVIAASPDPLRDDAPLLVVAPASGTSCPTTPDFGGKCGGVVCGVVCGVLAGGFATVVVVGGGKNVLSAT